MYVCEYKYYMYHLALQVSWTVCQEDKETKTYILFCCKHTLETIILIVFCFLLL